MPSLQKGCDSSGLEAKCTPQGGEGTELGWGTWLLRGTGRRADSGYGDGWQEKDVTRL